jgi:hypothetical protein
MIQVGEVEKMWLSEVEKKPEKNEEGSRAKRATIPWIGKVSEW